MVVATSHCLSCSSPTHPDDSYCQECGKFLVRDADGEEAGVAPVVEAVDQHSSEYLANLNPRSAKPVVALPVVAAAVALLLIVPLGIYALERSYTSISSQYICEQASKSTAEGHPGTAIELLNRLAIAHGSLTPGEKKMLDLALFKEADQYILAGNYQAALTDLNKISSEFTQVQEVQERSQVCKGYLAKNALIAAKPLRDTKRLNQPNNFKALERKLAAAQLKSRSYAEHKAASDKLTVVPIGAPVSVAGISEQARKIANATAATATESTSTAKESKAPVKSQQPAETAAADKANAKSKPSTGFAHNDVVRYNELLAGYFSSRSGVKGGDVHEPPSFREWMDMGKQKF